MLIKLVRALPLSVCYGFGLGIGVLLWLILPKYRRLAASNMRRAFAGEKDEKAIRRLVFDHFITMGANVLSAVKMAAIPPERVHQYVEMEGETEMVESLRAGQGVIAAISHIGNWELFAQLVTMVRPAPTGTIYQPLRNPYINKLIDNDRRRLGTVTFDRRKGFTGPIAMLKSGGMVGVLIDQSAGDSGVWTPFFGSLASTSPLTASLAVRTGARVIPIAIYSIGFARWRTVCSPSIPYDPENPDQLTADLNKVLEAQIRVSPKDWFWVHNRWKTPEPNFLLRRYKRGIYLPPGTDASRLHPFRLLVRSPNWLGDAVMSVPAVRAMKDGRPDMRLSILTPAKLADMWHEAGCADEIIKIEPEDSVFSVARKIRGRFDAAVLLPNSLRSALEVWLAGVPRRVGLAGHSRSWLLNQIPRKNLKRFTGPNHHARRYAEIARWLGAADPVVDFSRAPIPTGETIIGVCPGAEYGPAKRWLPDRFAEVIRVVSAQRYVRWIIVGTAKDKPTADEIVSMAGAGPKMENLAGRTSLGELIAHLKTLRVLLTNDTGTMHLAAMLGIPTVALFGSTEPDLTSPLGSFHTIIRHKVDCSPCFLRECPIDFPCMKKITAQEVAEAVLRTLEEKPDVSGLENPPGPTG